jgi:hypothetical protein
MRHPGSPARYHGPHGLLDEPVWAVEGRRGSRGRTYLDRGLVRPEPEDALRSLPDGGPPPDQGPHRAVSAGAGMLALTRGPNGSDVDETMGTGGDHA